MRSAIAAQPKGWDARYVNPDHPHDTSYYMKCIGGGILACGTTHTAVCPLDVVKCNMQVSPERFKSLVQGLQMVIHQEGYGSKGLMKGWASILFGYSIQGAFKFGLYEYFKDLYANMAGQENAKKYEGIIWLAGSASAEFFADMGLCPFEMTKVKVQTSPKGTFPTGMLAAMASMRADPSSGFPYKSLVPLWGRQIPYTMAKFFFFEKVVRMFYQYVFTKPKEQYNKATQLSITFASGYIAGVICAIVSHPADTLVSARGKASNAGKSYGQIAKEMGYINVCSKGLGTRILMIGTLTGLQWWIYDTYKTALGMGTSGH
ncbi:putative mitochondrial phosphate transporter [Leishmania infantum JPCM5]|uniref:Mitochondrial_phosphate_transporter_-_putative n=2 Tax=Leishmania infantum TaxID=5671 RepID=A0A6L0XT69_LEIIN|nr:putative mitochondrial phosphate transporter [Leishmania infantum JPCM5]CAC9546867.1 mitochondrial_phosphate_transporter_-_putative [Leishmania infantum]CAM72354.1 putative mitochondrial phosphate transporter [Leishmania infantum JPCM5]SUZ46273.1 mitochondrial_phosphate_transporter_-_putative [Leishmania infantum]|eukprot:XP_001469251.1 putative mitochondrial phosphate transporter [Leishmania infantum JPCM5]